MRIVNLPQARKRGETSRKPTGSTLKLRQVSSDIPLPNRRLRYTEGQFRYFISTRHYDDDGGGEWVTVRVAQAGDNVVVYRRQVMDSGTSLCSIEDGPLVAQDVAYMALAYKRKQRAKTAAWTDSDSDGYLKRNDSDSDGDSDDRGRPSRGNTSKPSSRQMRQGSVSGQPESESGTIETRSESDTHSAECTSMPVSIFKTTMPVSTGRLPVSISKSQTPVCSL